MLKTNDAENIDCPRMLFEMNQSDYDDENIIIIELTHASWPNFKCKHSDTPNVLEIPKP